MSEEKYKDIIVYGGANNDGDHIYYKLIKMHNAVCEYEINDDGIIFKAPIFKKCKTIGTCFNVDIIVSEGKRSIHYKENDVGFYMDPNKIYEFETYLKVWGTRNRLYKQKMRNKKMTTSIFELQNQSLNDLRQFYRSNYTYRKQLLVEILAFLEA